MAGVDVGGGGGKKRAVDAEINMIPFIDLLLVTISFLLLTAVWTHMARLNADAQVPGKQNTDDVVPTDKPKDLHIEMRGPEKFVLQWKQGQQVVNSVELPRKEVKVMQNNVEVVRFPDLATKITEEWKTNGQHAAPTDEKTDRAILHTDNKTEYKYIIGVIDALYGTQRDRVFGGKTEKIPAFNVTFAVN